jgi:hypothetical protein
VSEEIRCLKEEIPQIMLLSEGTQVKEDSEYFLLFKYQSAQEIVKEMLAQIADNDRISFTHKVTTKRRLPLFGVYAPFGGSGVTEYALFLAKEFAKKEKVLYVSLELFHGLDFLQFSKKGKEEVSCRGMSEVVFYLKQRREKLALKLETVTVSQEEVDYIYAVEDCRDLYSLTSEDIHCFLEVLSQQTDYASVVFDIGFISEAVLYLMEQCTKLYMPQAVTRQQQSKERAFFRAMLRGNHEKLAQGFERVAVQRGT